MNMAYLTATRPKRIHRKITSEEDNLTGDDLKRKQPRREMTSQEDGITERLPNRMTT